MFTCKDCDKRHLHCHSECEAYQRARKELDELNKKIRKEKDEQAILTAYVVDKKRKSKKKRNSKG